MLAGQSGMGLGSFSMDLRTPVIARTYQPGRGIVAPSGLFELIGGLHVVLLYRLYGGGVVGLVGCEFHGRAFGWREKRTSR
jgi:hypothetical protein